MIEFLLSFVVLLAIVAGMAIGVMRGRAPLAGTCGGLNNLGITGDCEICGGNPAKCDQESTNTTDDRRSGNYFDAG
jgi:hypothetical protein